MVFNTWRLNTDLDRLPDSAHNHELLSEEYVRIPKRRPIMKRGNKGTPNNVNSYNGDYDDQAKQREDAEMETSDDYHM